MEAFERLRGVLEVIQGVGVGCHYWTRERGVPADQLVELGLATSIRTRVPPCEEHGCHLLETCRQRILFAERGPGRAGRKVRLTEEGRAAAGSTAALAAHVAELPLARRVLDVLAEAGRPLSWFELYWRLLEPELDELAATGQPALPRLSRSGVRFALDMLRSAGAVDEGQGGGLVWLNAP
jgi:hypothetical protein